MADTEVPAGDLDGIRARPSNGKPNLLNARLAYAGAFISLTGVQLISPVLPTMREALGLSDQQVSLVIGAYLLPGAFGAIPAGMLADRIGRRRVFGWSLVGFGAIGLAFPALGSSFEVFLGLRFLQGLLFAGLLPLTMAIIGDTYSGNALVAAHGRRLVAMSLGDGIQPIIGGLLAAVAWWVPWLGQGTAILFGAVVLTRMTDPSLPSAGKRRKLEVRALWRLLRNRAIFALQYAGFLRMFLKFVLFTSLALLLVNERGFGTAFAGTVLGTSALSATAVAASAGAVTRHFRPAAAVAAGFTFMGFALIGYATVSQPVAIFLVAVVYGASDGLLSVFTNALITAVTSTENRATFVGVTGAIRSLGKVMAPVVVAVTVTFAPITTLLLACAGLALAATLAAFSMRPLELSLTDTA